MLPGSEGKKQLAALGGVGLVGIEMGVSILVGFLGGRWLDGKFGTGFLAWIGFAFGVAAGFRSLYRIGKQTQRRLSGEKNPAEENPTNPEP